MQTPGLLLRPLRTPAGATPPFDRGFETWRVARADLVPAAAWQVCGLGGAARDRFLEAGVDGRQLGPAEVELMFYPKVKRADGGLCDIRDRHSVERALADLLAALLEEQGVPSTPCRRSLVESVSRSVNIEW